MVATLFRDAQTGGYTVADQRLYGAWGEIRGGATSGDPKGRYVANLGHVQDDESGLIYMRARYYEPSTGRFVSEDPGQSGRNWFLYCENDGINWTDVSGKYKVDGAFRIGVFGFFFALGLDCMIVAWAFAAIREPRAALVCIVAAAQAFNVAFACTDIEQDIKIKLALANFFMNGSGAVAALAIVSGLQAGGAGVGSVAVLADCDLFSDAPGLPLPVQRGLGVISCLTP